MTTSDYAAEQEQNLEQLRSILSAYPQERSSLVMVLQDLQATMGYLPRSLLIEVGRFLDVPRAHVFHVATFFKAFSLTPRGRCPCTVCMGTACHVRGASLLVEHLERSLGIKAGETSEDLEFSLETVNCVGACALGPLAIIDGQYVGAANASKIDKVLRRLRRKENDTQKGAGSEP